MIPDEATLTMETPDSVEETSLLGVELLAAFPLERWARIAASLDVNDSAEPQVLEANKLVPEDWERLCDHWLGVQQEALDRGDANPLEASDGAYFQRLEEERGPISTEEYASLVVAAERGTQAQALKAAEIPDKALIVVERVWVRRCGGDPELAEATDGAIAQARSAG